MTVAEALPEAPPAEAPVPDDTPQPDSLLVDPYIDSARSAAWAFVKRVPYGSVSFDDVLSAAYEGLVRSARCWAGYCAARGFNPDISDPKVESFYRTYSGRRMKGAILDLARGMDPLTRSTRQVLKRIDNADPSQAIREASDAEAAAASGQELATVKAARQAEAGKPSSLDDRPADGWSVTDLGVDAESAVVVADINAAALDALQVQPALGQIAVALRHHQGLDFRAIGRRAGVPETAASAAYKAAVLAVWQAMAEAASDGEGKPAQHMTAVEAACQALAAERAKHRVITCEQCGQQAEIGHPAAKFCSVRCRDTAYVRVRRERRREAAGR